MKARRGTRLKIQRVSVTQNTRGEEVETWTTLDTVWASVIPNTPREFYDTQASRVVTHQPYTLGFRWGSEISSLTAKDRAVLASSTGTIYDFEADPVNVNERNVEYQARALIRG